MKLIIQVSETALFDEAKHIVADIECKGMSFNELEALLHDVGNKFLEAVKVDFKDDKVSAPLDQPST